MKNCAVHARRNQEYFEGTAEDSSGKRSGRKGESYNVKIRKKGETFVKGQRKRLTTHTHTYTQQTLGY